jgi:transposase
VSRSLKAHIASLRKALAALETEIAAHVKACEALARKARLMRTLKGVGPATVAALLAYMPELGSFTKGEAACIAGAFQGLRHIQAGRAAIRKTLYMAALVAIQHNPVMRLFANKLRRNGKPSKVVITAVMRKLIVTLNAILRSGEPWSHAKIA